MNSLGERYFKLCKELRDNVTQGFTDDLRLKFEFSRETRRCGAQCEGLRAESVCWEPSRLREPRA